MGTLEPDSNQASSSAHADRHWHIVQRWQEYSGESRAAFIRVAGIGIFYAVELLNYHGLSAGPFSWPKLASADATHHVRVTTLAGAWIMVAVAVMLCLERRIFPPWLKYVATGADMLLLSLVLMMTGGAGSPLVAAYFLLIALAGLRFSLHLVWCATAGCAVGYLLQFVNWFPQTDKVAVPRHDQAITLLALILMGVIVGQMVRRVRVLAVHFAERASGEPTS